MRKWSSSNQWTWETTDADIGVDNRIKCVVKDKYGEIDAENYLNYEIKKPVNPPTVDVFKPNLEEPQPAGINVTWSCLGNDADGDLLRYIFRIRGPSTNNTWVTMRGYRKGRKWRWLTTEEDVGETDVKCVVKDYPAGNKASKIYHNYEIS
jgi:hypothetical protein